MSVGKVSNAALIVIHYAINIDCRTAADSGESSPALASAPVPAPAWQPLKSDLTIFKKRKIKSSFAIH